MMSSIKADFNSSVEEFLHKSRDFSGKVVLVTGSNSGIGEGITKLFAALGAHTVVNGRNADAVKKVAQEVEELSPKRLKPLQFVGDLTVDDNAEKLVNETINTFGRLDVLVNNIGIISYLGVRDKCFIKEFDNVWNTDVRAALVMSHLAVPYLEKTNGSIIQISSLSSMAVAPSTTSYSMSKSAMDMMTRGLAVELGPKVRVNTINCGSILTEKFRDITDPVYIKVRENAEKATPVKRLGDVLDIAKAVAFLSSTDASFITGANLLVDGGLIFNVGQVFQKD